MNSWELFIDVSLSSVDHLTASGEADPSSHSICHAARTPDLCAPSFSRIPSEDSPFPLPTFQLLIKGKEIDTGRYRHFVPAGKMLGDRAGAMQVLKALKAGEIP